MRALRALAATLCLPLLPASARAEAPGRPIEVPMAPGEAPVVAGPYAPPDRWYALPILISDGVLLATAAVFAASIEGGFNAARAPWALLPALATGPIVHFVHDDPGRAFASLGIRTASLGLGLVVGRVAADPLEFTDPRAAGFVWFGATAAAVVGATAIDAAVFGFQRATKRAPRAAALVPFAAPAQDGSGVVAGVGGAL